MDVARIARIAVPTALGGVGVAVSFNPTREEVREDPSANTWLTALREAACSLDVGLGGAMAMAAATASPSFAAAMPGPIRAALRSGAVRGALLGAGGLAAGLGVGMAAGSMTGGIEAAFAGPKGAPAK